MDHLVLFMHGSTAYYVFFNCTVKLGVGGFSMGAAMALYSATCFVHGKYNNGNSYPVNLSVAVGLSGWLPCARYSSSFMF